MKSRISYFVVAWSVVFFATAELAVSQGQKTAGEVLRQFNKLSPEARTKALLEKAKSEGEVTIYSTMRVNELAKLIKAFNKRFPFLKVNVNRISGRQVATKILIEYKAGRYEVDIANGFAHIGYALKTEGVLDPYYSPEKRFFSVPDKDKEGLFAPAYVAPVVLGYNTNLVKPDEVPRTYEDLLLPKWKGKMFLDEEDYDWFIILLDHFGRKKGLEYMKKLVQQDLSMRRGRVLQTQLLGAGEMPIAIALHAHSLLDFKEKGAPIDYAILDPYFAKPSDIVLFQKAPHPHAAAVFIDWVLSKEAQSMMVSFGRISGREDIKYRYPDIVKKKYIYAGAETIGPKLGTGIKEFWKIFR